VRRAMSREQPIRLHLTFQHIVFDKEIEWIDAVERSLIFIKKFSVAGP
jgi:hypothetical protein